MRCKGKLDPRVMKVFIPKRESFFEIFIRTSRPCRRDIDEDHAEGCPNARHHDALSGDVRKKIHVIKGGYATPDHFSDRKISAIANKHLSDKALFQGPYVLSQPGHQREVIGDPSKEGHGRMGMGIDEPRDQNMVLKRFGRDPLIAGHSIGDRQ